MLIMIIWHCCLRFFDGGLLTSPSWFHVAHAIFKPWGAGTATYRVQHFAEFVTTFIFVMGLLFKVKGALCVVVLLTCFFRPAPLID